MKRLIPGQKDNVVNEVSEIFKAVSSTLKNIESNVEEIAAHSKMETLRIRRETIQELPSHNFDVLNIRNDPICSAMKERKYSIEVLKLNKESNRNLRRRITHADVEQIAELMLHSKLKIRDVNAPLDVKKKIVRVVHERLLEEEQEVVADSKLFQILTIIKDLWVKFQNKCDLWGNTIETIRGHYGSEVVIYFTFLRSLVLMNVINIAVILVFIVGPALTINAYHSNVTTEDVEKSSSAPFALKDLITGSGSFENTLLYYSGYHNGSVAGYFGSKGKFDCPVGYILSIISLFIMNLIFICYSICMQFHYASVFKSSLNIRFCCEVFSSWDFHTLTEKSALIKHHNICFSMKELLHNEKVKELAKNQDTRLESAQVVLFYALMLSLSGIVLSIFYDRLNSFIILEETGFLHKLSIALYATISILALHYLVKFFTKFETFLSEKVRIYFISFRTLTFRLGMLVILLYFWTPETGIGGITKRDMSCFETFEGKEIYKISIMNFLINTLGLLGFFCIFWSVVHFFHLRHALHDYFPEFNVAFHVTDLIFYQTLIWIGAFYVPLLPVVVLLIFILNFYIMKHSLSWCYMPSKQRFSCRLSNIFFLSLLLISFMFCLVNVAFKIFYVKPSTTCGPFKFYKFAYYRVLQWTKYIMKEDNALGFFITFIRSPSFVITLILSLMVSIHFIHEHYSAYRKSVQFLEHQLQEEEQYKSILLKLYEEGKKKVIS